MGREGDFDPVILAGVADRVGQHPQQNMAQGAGVSAHQRGPGNRGQAPTAAAAAKLAGGGGDRFGEGGVQIQRLFTQDVRIRVRQAIGAEFVGQPEQQTGGGGDRLGTSHARVL